MLFLEFLEIIGAFVLALVVLFVVFTAVALAAWWVVGKVMASAIGRGLNW